MSVGRPLDLGIGPVDAVVIAVDAADRPVGQLRLAPGRHRVRVHEVEEQEVVEERLVKEETVVESESNAPEVESEAEAEVKDEKVGDVADVNETEKEVGSTLKVSGFDFKDRLRIFFNIPLPVSSFDAQNNNNDVTKSSSIDFNRKKAIAL